jgi:hypothetical protein
MVSIPHQIETNLPHARQINLRNVENGSAAADGALGRIVVTVASCKVG